MHKITKFNVLKIAYVFGLFGVFIGFLLSIVFSIVLLISPDLILSYVSVSMWQIFVLFPIGFGILMFLKGIIFVPLINLALKITKGFSFNLEVVNEMPKPKVPLQKPVVNQQDKKQNIPISKPAPKTPIKPAM